MPNRFRFVLGALGFSFLKLLSGVGFKSFSAECLAASFRRSFSGCALCMLQSEGKLKWMQLFHSINKLSPSPIALENLSMSLHFLGDTPSRLPNAQGSLQKGLPL